MQPLHSLLQDEFQVHRIDLPGHGAAPVAEDFSIAGFAAALRDHLVNIGAPVSIFGYSMGGYVALYAARHFDLPIERIITLGTKFDWRPETADREASRLNPDKILEKVPAFAAQLAVLHGEHRWQQVVRNTATMMMQMGMEPPLQDEDFRHIHAPVHLLLGDQDQMVTEAETRSIQQLLPAASFELLENTLHPIDAVDKKQLASKLKAILAGG